MGSSNLSQERRAQLAGIVEKMTANKEKEEDIQMVVDHFKQKYGNEQEVESKPNGSSIGENIAGFAGSTVGGPIGETVAKTAYRKGVDVIENPRENALKALGTLPMAGATAGAFAGEGVASIPLAALGSAGGEAINQLGRRALGADPTRDIKNPITGSSFGRIPGTSQEASNIIQEGGVAAAIQSLGLGAVKGWEQLAKGMKTLQKSAAGSAVGGMKNVYNQIKGGSKAFNESAIALQEKGAFGPFTNPETMKVNVEKISEAAGEKIGQTLEQIDNSGAIKIKASKVAKALYDDLKKGFDTGYAKNINKEAKKVFDTIKGYGDEITFKQLQEIKNTINPGKWGDFQVSGMGEDARKIFEIRQRAVGKLGKIIEDGVAMSELKIFGTLGKTPKLLSSGKSADTLQSTKTAFEEYKNAKKVYGQSQDILKGLEDKIKRLEGKQSFGFAEKGAGFGALTSAFGGDTKAVASWLATGAGIKYLRSFGPQQGAILFNAIAKTHLPKEIITTVIQSLRANRGKQD